LPLSAGAQTAEEAATAEPGVQEPAPSSEPAPEEPEPSAEPAPEEPALQLELDSAGVEVTPSPPRTPDGYTLEEMEVRVRRAKNWLIAFASLSAVGAIVMGSAAWAPATCTLGEPCAFANRMAAGGSLMGIGAIGMIISGVRLRRHKRDRDSLRAAHYTTPRRVQWDRAQSRVVF
jgi:hypothetical protein